MAGCAALGKAPLKGELSPKVTEGFQRLRGSLEGVPFLPIIKKRR